MFSHFRPTRTEGSFHPSVQRGLPLSWVHTAPRAPSFQGSLPLPLRLYTSTCIWGGGGGKCLGTAQKTIRMNASQCGRLEVEQGQGGRLLLLLLLPGVVASETAVLAFLSLRFPGWKVGLWTRWWPDLCVSLRNPPTRRGRAPKAGATPPVSPNSRPGHTLGTVPTQDHQEPGAPPPTPPPGVGGAFPRREDPAASLHGAQSLWESLDFVSPLESLVKFPNLF